MQKAPERRWCQDYVVGNGSQVCKLFDRSEGLLACLATRRFSSVSPLYVTPCKVWLPRFQH